jgi:hypothetical protein
MFSVHLILSNRKMVSGLSGESHSCFAFNPTLKQVCLFRTSDWNSPFVAVWGNADFFVTTLCEWWNAKIFYCFLPYYFGLVLYWQNLSFIWFSVVWQGKIFSCLTHSYLVLVEVLSGYNCRCFVSVNRDQEGLILQRFKM